MFTKACKQVGKGLKLNCLPSRGGYHLICNKLVFFCSTGQDHTFLISRLFFIQNKDQYYTNVLKNTNLSLIMKKTMIV